MTTPVFFYDFSSPYSYMSANRVDEVLPSAPRWQPIMFGALIQAIGKVPWSIAWISAPGAARSREHLVDAVRAHVRVRRELKS